MLPMWKLIFWIKNRENIIGTLLAETNAYVLLKHNITNKIY